MTFKDEEQIFNLISPIIKLYKSYDSGTKKDCIDDLPDFYPNYKTAAKYAERVRIHSETGKFPEDLFKNRYPNQTPKEFKYMKENYKQNTLPVFVDYISTNTRPFSDGNWNIEYENEEVRQSESYQHYLENEIEITGSLKTYFRTLLPSIKAVDANGVIAIKPEEMYVLEIEGELVADDTKMLRPQPYYFPTLQVLSDPRNDDDFIILELSEKSVIEVAGKKEKKGRIFEVYDENNIWRIEQVGKGSDYSFSVSLYYYHGSGKIMAQRLKGIPQYLNDSYLWLSPFLYACDLLDRALVHDNYLNCSVSNTHFPYRVRLGQKCTYKHKDDSGNFWECSGGLVFSSKTSSMENCPKCSGTGLRDRVSPTGEMLLNPSDMNSEGDVKFSGKAMEYVSPATDASEFVLKYIDGYVTKAYEVIKAKRVSQATGAGIDPANGTATKEILDQKTQQSAVKLSCEQSFNLYRFMAWGIGWQRLGSKFKEPVITDPTSYDFNTEQDYLNQITQAQNAKLAPTIIQNYIYKYLQAIYYNQRKTAYVFELLKSTDRLFVLSQDDVLMKFNRGLAQTWEVVLHDSAISFIDELIIENADAEFCDMEDCTKGFFALEFSEQKRLLVEKAKAKAAEVKASNPSGTSLLDKAREMKPAA